MSELWLLLLPLAITSAITPTKTFALILLFRSDRGALTGAAFVAGFSGALLAQGAILALVFTLFGVFAAPGREAAQTVSFALLMAMGLLMLAGALKLLFQEQDDDRPPPSWMEGIEAFTPRKAVSLGFGWAFVSPKQWVFTLATISILYAANLGQVRAFANYAVFVAIATSTLWLLVLVDALFGERIKPTLDRLFMWLKRNVRTLVIGLLLVFGVYFFLSGVMGLAA